MPKTIICDTSCLILLTNIGELQLLHQVYNNLVTTPQVASEYGSELPEWISIELPVNEQMIQILQLQVDKGEASTIALALETSGSTLILDDLKARKAAERLGLSITGTIGIIIKAKLKGIIPFIKPILEKMKATNFRLNEELEKEALFVAGE